MADDDFHTRMSRLEWRMDAVEASYQKQQDRLGALHRQLDRQHHEIMEGMALLRDQMAKQEGAKESRQATLKWLSFALAFLGTLVAAGWMGSDGAEGAFIYSKKVDSMPPIPVQYHSRDIP